MSTVFDVDLTVSGSVTFYNGAKNKGRISAGGGVFFSTTRTTRAQ